MDIVGVERVHIISYMGLQRSREYKQCLAKRGGLLECTGLVWASIHFCQPRDKWPLLEERKISFCVDDRRDIIGWLDDEAERRSSTVPARRGYDGPQLLVLVPTEYQHGRTASLDGYRRFVTQRRHNRLVLARSLGQAVDLILEFSLKTYT